MVNEAGASTVAPDRSTVQNFAVEWTRAKVVIHSVVAPAPQPELANRLMSTKCDVNFLRIDSRCRRYVSVLSSVIPRFGFGAKRQGFVVVVDFQLTLASLLLRCKTANTALSVLSFNFQVWKYSPRVAISLLRNPSTICQFPSA